MRPANEEMNRWEQLAQRATKAPWRVWELTEAVDHALEGWGDIASLVVESERRSVAGLGEQVFVVQGKTENLEQGNRAIDAQFIAAARDAVPVLCARIRELEAELARLRAQR